MNKSLLVQKVFVLMAIAFILIQSFFIPISSAAWSGTPWKGDPWEGNSWEGDDWKGESWQGEIQEKGTWNNGSQSGTPDSQTGNGPNLGSGVPGIGNVQPPYKIPNYIPGDHLIGDNSNPANPGSLIPVPSLLPEQTNNNSPSGERDEKEKNKADSWDITSYVGNTIINGQVGFVVSVLEQGDNLNPTSVFGKPNFLTGILMNGVKMGLGDGTSFDYYHDAYSAVEMGYGIYDTAEKYSKYVKATQAVDIATDIVPTVLSTPKPPMGILTKFNIATASISTAFSAIDTGIAIKDAIDTFNSDKKTNEKVSAGADAFASFGTTLFNGGLLAASIPGGQTAGLVLAGVGAAIFAVGKGVKYVADNWSKIKESKIGKAVSKGWNNFKKKFSFGFGS